MTRYFPELVAALKCGNTANAASSTAKSSCHGAWPGFRGAATALPPGRITGSVLAEQTPAAFIAFDLLALGGDDYTGRPFHERRAALVDAQWPHVRSLVPCTRPPPTSTTARRWFAEFEGAGLDGVVAKPLGVTYQPDKRVMFKIKPERTADCVVAGYRMHKSGAGRDRLATARFLQGRRHAGVGRCHRCLPDGRAARTLRRIPSLVTTFDQHPWNWAAHLAGDARRAERGIALERRQGPLVRAAAARAGGRGPLRPHGRRTVPPHRAVQPLAPRPRSPLMHLRPTRAAG